MKKLMALVIVLAVAGMVFASTTFANTRILAAGEQALTAAIGPQEDGRGNRPQRQGRPDRKGNPRRGPMMALRALVITQDAQLAELMEKSVVLSGKMNELHGKNLALFGKMVKAAKAGDKEALRTLAETGKDIHALIKPLQKKIQANRKAIGDRLKELKPQLTDKIKEFRGKHGRKGEDRPAPERDAPPALD